MVKAYRTQPPAPARFSLMPILFPWICRWSPGNWPAGARMQGQQPLHPQGEVYWNSGLLALLWIAVAKMQGERARAPAPPHTQPPILLPCLIPAWHHPHTDLLWWRVDCGDSPCGRLLRTSQQNTQSNEISVAAIYVQKKNYPTDILSCFQLLCSPNEL
eukprot:scaffold1513_cov141-Cylindrotheca_fusiformis.AAC.2